jgi:uncharacterized membrane protein YhaH (DUF805 family)
MKPTPKDVHHLALAAAAGMSGIALFDAGTKALTGHYSLFSDDSTIPWALHASTVVHGLAYLSLIAVLVQHRHRIEGVNRTARVSFWVLLCSLCVLAVGFLVLLPFLDPQEMPAVPGGAVGLAFAGMLLGAPALGIAVRRMPELRPGSLILMAMVPILAVTILLGIVEPRLAHPAYLEGAMAFGVALLGYRGACVPAAGTVSVDPVSASGRRRS